LSILIIIYFAQRYGILLTCLILIGYEIITGTYKERLISRILNALNRAVYQILDSAEHFLGSIVLKTSKIVSLAL
jgi:hypothetical protein